MERYQIRLMQGESLKRTILLKQAGEIFDLTGYSAEAQIRKYPNAEELLSELECTVVGEEGKICLSLDASITETLPLGEAVYDLRMISPEGEVTYLLGGIFELCPSVTKGGTDGCA